MPPLNHKTDLQRSGVVYQVGYQECNTAPGGDKAYTQDTWFVETLSAAIKAAMHVFDDDPLFNRSGTGMIVMSEPHEDDEPYERVVIRERRVYKE
jgi:hypothetical protein